MNLIEKKERLEQLTEEYTVVMREYHYSDASNTLDRCRKRLQELAPEITRLSVEIKDYEKQIEMEKAAVKKFLEKSLIDKSGEWKKCIEHLIEINNIRTPELESIFEKGE